MDLGTLVTQPHDMGIDAAALEGTMKKTVLGVVVLGLAACGGQSTGTPPATQTSSPSSEPAPTDLAQQQALHVYREMWTSFVQAGTTSDPQHPGLTKNASGLALDKLDRSLRTDRDKGLVTKGEPKIDPKVSSAEPTNDPTKIVVTDCGDSTTWLKYRKDNGQLADDRPGGRRLIKAIVEKRPDGTWTVTDYGVQGVGTC